MNSVQEKQKTIEELRDEINVLITERDKVIERLVIIIDGVAVISYAAFAVAFICIVLIGLK